MAPIDVSNVPPPAPPPPDDDKDRAKEREREERPDHFLRVMKQSSPAARKEQEVRQQQEAQREKAQEHAEHHEAAVAHDDRERGAASRDATPREPSGGDGRGAGVERAAADRDSAARSDAARTPPAADGRTTSGANDSATKRSSERADGDLGTKSVKDDKPEKDDKAGRNKQARGRGAKLDESGSIEKPKRSEAPIPDAGLAASFQPAQQLPAKGQVDVVIPQAVLRQAVEFAAFAEKGGLIEFSLGLAGNLLGGAVLTLKSLGNRKIAIKVTNGSAGSADRIDERDLDELVARMRARGIEVAEVVVC